MGQPTTESLFFFFDQSQNVKTYLPEMPLLEHELGDVAEDSASASSRFWS
jgi:hypothetical protein